MICHLKNSYRSEFWCGRLKSNRTERSNFFTYSNFISLESRSRWWRRISRSVSSPRLASRATPCPRTGWRPPSPSSLRARSLSSDTALCSLPPSPPAPTQAIPGTRGWDLAKCGWDLAKCGWDLAKCGWDLARSWMRSSQVVRTSGCQC